jgi:hypothetical protein
MAVEGVQPLKTTAKAGADLSAKQYYFVKLNADNQVIVCAAATDIPAGVLQNNPANGDAAEICVVGETKISGDADLDAGHLIGTSADGQADRKIAGTDTTEYIVGQVKEGNGAAGGLVTAFVNCASPSRAA